MLIGHPIAGKWTSEELAIKGNGVISNGMVSRTNGGFKPPFHHHLSVRNHHRFYSVKLHVPSLNSF